VVALNSNCAEIGGCHAGSPQERWLRTDLVAHPARCTVAYMHHPAFSSGNLHGGSPSVLPLLRALQDHRAELLLSGHDHDYERFAPQTVEAAVNPVGVRQFVVGTGGASLRQFAPQPAANSEARIAGVYGVLALKLRPAAYDWRFVAQPGSSASDSGTSACR
jgi:3',5'-cyclic AMP phosphodiesterase CpdA